MAKYDTSKFPDWLKSLSDSQLDDYFNEHPNSKYLGKNKRGGGESTDNPANDDPDEQHKLPLIKRLTFGGWAKSAPKKEVRQKKEDYSEMMDDISLDNADIQDVISDLKEQNDDDRETRKETNSPRRKKRMGKRIAKRTERIAALKEKVTKNQERIHKLRKRVRLLDQQLKKR